MSANLTPQTLKLSEWLSSARKSLSDIGIESAILDSELILSHVLRKSRTFLHANPDYQLSTIELSESDSLLNRRLSREPIAYLFKSKEFYGRDFIVSNDTLIPRPESEQIIEFAKELLSDKDCPYKIADVGTGSGCLGITIKKELPNSIVTLIDISRATLNIAQKNAKMLDAEINIIESNLLERINNEKFDTIVANLPYVDKKTICSPETKFEPQIALFAEDDGLALIKNLIVQATSSLNRNGILILESDVDQQQYIINYAKKHNFVLEKNKDLITVFRYQN